MEMIYDGMLALPSSYAVMDEEEMTYVEGGGIPRSVAATIIDIPLTATPLGAAFAPFKYMGKAAGKALIKKYAGGIAGKLGWALTKLGGMAGSSAANFTAGKVLGLMNTLVSCATSLGGCISLVLDAVDSQGLNGWVGKKGWSNFSW